MLSLDALRHALLVAVAGAFVGALLGVVWEWAWTPPTGAAWKGEWLLDPEGVMQDVSSTGWFTLIGLVGGIAYGSLAARWGLRRPLATLVGVTLGSFAIAYVMYHVGHALGPPDPRPLAMEAEDWEPIVSDLRLAGVEHPMRPFSLETGAVVAPGIGALIGLIGLFLGGSGVPRTRRGAQD
ncbi:hypothetical protein [Nocardioides gilvus]|uniref:hypothetical protein n=1 Tax=Nocardioides gilvus TaxID=1735589 RepID=UPI000D741D68|nr:hypothetical protein [Nocardioides gilvus]